MSTLAENAAAVKAAQVAIDAAIVAKGGTTDGGLANAAAASAARRPPTVVAVPLIGKPPNVAEISLSTATEFVSMFSPTARTAFEKVGLVAEMSPVTAISFSGPTGANSEYTSPSGVEKISFKELLNLSLPIIIVLSWESK